MSRGMPLAMMPFWVRDYITATRQFTLAERGAYTDLLFFQWEQGVLPNDPDRLSRLLGVSREEFDEVWKTLSIKFLPTREGLSNVKLEQHRAKAVQLSQKRKVAGSRGGKASAEAAKSTRSQAQANAAAIAAPSAAATVHSPSPSPSSESYIHTQGRGPVAIGADDYERWLQIKAAYPPGIYKQHAWLEAEREARMAVDDGLTTWGEWLAAVHRYHDQQRAIGNLGQPYITRPDRFFARSAKSWAEPFPIPAAPQARSAALTGVKLMTVEEAEALEAARAKH